MQRLEHGLIIPPGPADAARLGEVHVRSWRETYAGLLPSPALAAMDPVRHARRFRAQLLTPRPGAVTLAVETRDGLVGYSEGTAGADGASEVQTLYILRAAQRRGHGRALLRGMARSLAACGAGSLRLWVLSTNLPAQTFYRRLGGAQELSRAVKGWGPGLTETLYVWRDIGELTG